MAQNIGVRMSHSRFPLNGILNVAATVVVAVATFVWLGEAAVDISGDSTAPVVTVVTEIGIGLLPIIICVGVARPEGEDGWRVSRGLKRGGGFATVSLVLFTGLLFFASSF